MAVRGGPNPTGMCDNRPTNHMRTSADGPQSVTGIQVGNTIYLSGDVSTLQNPRVFRGKWACIQRADWQMACKDLKGVKQKLYYGSARSLRM